VAKSLGKKTMSRRLRCARTGLAETLWEREKPARYEYARDDLPQPAGQSTSWEITNVGLTLDHVFGESHIPAPCHGNGLCAGSLVSDLDMIDKSPIRLGRERSANYPTDSFSNDYQGPPLLPTVKIDTIWPLSSPRDRAYAVRLCSVDHRLDIRGSYALDLMKSAQASTRAQ
jgi:hypothetical protein